MKKRLSIIVALVMALTMFWIPGQSLAAFADEPDGVGNGTVQSDDNTIQARAVEYTVTFDSQGGTEVAPQRVEEGGYAVKPESPTRDPYTFVGWYYGSEPFDFEHTQITDNITLTAHWEEKSEPVEVGTLSVKCSCTKNTITFNWTVSGNVDKVVITINGNDYTVTSGTSKKIEGLKGSTSYSYTVTPYYEGEKGKAVTGSIRTDGPMYSGSYEYYYKNGSMVKNGYVQFEDTKLSGGKKYNMYHWYDENGVFRGRSKKMYNAVKNDSSKAKYLIAVDRDNDVFCVYAGKKGNRYPVKYWLCVCGRPGHKTPCGRFTVKSKKWGFSGYADNGRSGKGNKKYAYTVWHATRFVGSVFVHSQLYKRGSKSSFIPGGAVIGQNRSHGCVRLYITYAAWVKNNCAKGTVIRVMTK